MKVRVGDVQIAYDRAGSGDPVLLVMGLSTARIGWFNQMPVLAQRFDVCALDNRGVGETDAPVEPWTMADMADDAVGLADHLGWDRIHVVGISMGGMISQEIALRHPHRVRSLALLATHHGGPDTELPGPAVMDTFAAFGMDLSEGIRRMIRHSFGKRYQQEHPELIELATTFAVENQPPMHGVLNQVMAVGGWSASGGAAARLGEVDVPTLVVHGTADELIPLSNGERLAKAIPGSRLEILPDAGHAIVQERADEVNALLLEHLGAI